MFCTTKDGMVEPTCQQLKKFERAGMGVEVLRMDNAGENKLLANRMKCLEWDLGVEIEYTARDTPQQNSPV